MVELAGARDIRAAYVPESTALPPSQLVKTGEVSECTPLPDLFYPSEVTEPSSLRGKISGIP
jgi:hypothetical protein